MNEICVIVRTPEESAKVQEKLFLHGYYWYPASNKVNLMYPVLFAKIDHGKREIFGGHKNHYGWREFSASEFLELKL